MACHLALDHAHDRVVEARDLVAGHGRLGVAATDARVVGEEQVATARVLRGLAERELGGRVHTARGDGIDLHALLRGVRDRGFDLRLLAGVVRSVRDDEHHLRDVRLGAPCELRPGVESLGQRFGEVADAARALRVDLAVEHVQVGREVE